MLFHAVITYLNLNTLNAKILARKNFHIFFSFLSELASFFQPLGFSSNIAVAYVNKLLLKVAPTSSTVTMAEIHAHNRVDYVSILV